MITYIVQKNLESESDDNSRSNNLKSSFMSVRDLPGSNVRKVSRSIAVERPPPQFAFVDKRINASNWD